MEDSERAEFSARSFNSREASVLPLPTSWWAKSLTVTT